MKLSGKVALVTGGNRGIGFEVCRQLAREGAKVILSARDITKANAAAGTLTEEGLNVVPLLLDVSKIDSVTSVIPELSKVVDVLINSAAILDRQSFLEVGPEDIAQTIATNLRGPILLAHGLAGGMVKRKWGRIVQVTSGMGSFARGLGADSVLYRTTKAALNAFTNCLAQEVEGHNVLVNAVDPGWVKTKMGGPHAPRSVEEGAAGILWAALLPDHAPSGGFYHDGQKRDW